MSSELLAALRAAGWHEDRAVDVSTWKTDLEAEGFHMSTRTRDILSNFGGLTLKSAPVPDAKFRTEGIVVDPMEGSGEADLLEDFASLLDEDFFPIGSWISHSTVYVAPSGQTIAYGTGRVWRTGTNFNEALELMLLARSPLVPVFEWFDDQWWRIVDGQPQPVGG